MTVEFLDMTTPSDALTNMVNGLLTYSANRQFRVNMMTFGHTRGMRTSICYGCAATYASLDAMGAGVATNRKLQLKNTGFRRPERAAAYMGLIGMDTPRGNIVDTDFYKELKRFELAVDLARTGRMRSLFKFFGLAREWSPLFDQRFSLETWNWQDQLGAVQELIDELEELDL